MVKFMNINFNLDIGKIYAWTRNQDEEFVYNINRKNRKYRDVIVKVLMPGDYVMFLEPPKGLGHNNLLYCKVITADGIIGFIMWDHYSYGAFTILHE